MNVHTTKKDSENNGLYCKNAHTEKRLWEDYMYGFCIRGPSWDKVHLKTIVNTEDDDLETLANYGIIPGSSAPDTKVICHKCGNRGHKSDVCK